MTLENILLKIRIRRQQLNYSQEYIATRLEMSQSCYNKIENGTRILDVKLLIEIFNILDMNIIDLQ